MAKGNEKKVKERERDKERKEADTTRLELSTEGKGLGWGTKDKFEQKHEYLSSLGAVGVCFCFWSSGYVGRRVKLGGPEEPS